MNIRIDSSLLLLLCEEMDKEQYFLNTALDNLKLYQQSLPEAIADDGYKQLNEYTDTILKYVQEGTEHIATLSKELKVFAEKLSEVKK